MSKLHWTWPKWTHIHLHWYLANILIQHLLFDVLMSYSGHNLQSTVIVSYFADPNLPIFVQLTFGWYFQPKAIFRYCSEPDFLFWLNSYLFSNFMESIFESYLEVENYILSERGCSSEECDSFSHTIFYCAGDRMAQKMSSYVKV